MKRLLLVIGLLTAQLCFSQNALQELQSNKAIAQFLNKHLSKTHTYASLFQKKENTRTVTKKDLDNNGLTDLIIEASEPPHHLIILNLGNHVFEELLFEEKQDFFNTAILDTIVTVKNRHLLVYNTPIYTADLDFIPDRTAIVKASNKFHDSVLFQKTDTLMIHYDMLLRYNSAPKNSLKIKHMTLTLESCYWYCPQYTVSIDSNGVATYKNLLLDDEELTTIQLNHFELYLFNYLVNYLDVERLNSIPSILINDGQAITITITLDDDSTIYLKNYTGQIQQQEYYPIYQKLAEVRDRLLQLQQQAIPKHHDIYFDRKSF